MRWNRILGAMCLTAGLVLLGGSTQRMAYGDDVEACPDLGNLDSECDDKKATPCVSIPLQACSGNGAKKKQDTWDRNNFDKMPDFKLGGPSTAVCYIVYNCSKSAKSGQCEPNLLKLVVEKSAENWPPKDCNSDEKKKRDNEKLAPPNGE